MRKEEGNVLAHGFIMFMRSFPDEFNLKSALIVKHRVSVRVCVFSPSNLSLVSSVLLQEPKRAK